MENMFQIDGHGSQGIDGFQHTILPAAGRIRIEILVDAADFILKYIVSLVNFLVG